MTERKLTSEQIEDLFELCEFHNVHYYDVQIELVDHLASAIEALWQTSPELSFEEAAFQVGEQFGVEPFSHSSYNSILPSITGLHFSGESGFEAIKEAKEKELHRKYHRLQWQYIGEFYRLPKIMLTIAISLLLYAVMKMSSNLGLLGLISLGIYSISLLIYLVFFFKKESQLELTTGKSFLQIDYLNSIRSSLFTIGFLPFNLINIANIVLREFKFPQTSIYFLELLIAFLLTLFVYLMIAMCSYIPRRIKDDFTREFPQFVKS